MPRSDAQPIKKLEIRVTQEGRFLHIRVDAFVGDKHVGFAAEREHGALDLDSFPAATTAGVMLAVHDHLCQGPLF